jgi:hypothetical protein
MDNLQLNELIKKYPKMHHAPLENCPQCGGTGERKNEFSSTGFSACMCIFVNHDMLKEARDMMQEIIDEIKWENIR